MSEAEALLSALHEAILVVTGDLALDNVLQHIVDAARRLLDAEYAALGVPGNEPETLESFVTSGIEPETRQAIPHTPRGHGLLGAVVTEQAPIRLENMAADPRAVGFPPHHPMMTSFLGVPIVANRTLLGNLYLTDKRGDTGFSEQDQQIAEMFAAHAAVAIQNARLYEQVERLAVLAERSRIGMDLHDGVIQSIYAVGLTLETAKLALSPANNDAEELIDTAITGLDGAIQDIRNFIMDLRPRQFRGNLVQGINQLVREFQANTVIPVRLEVAIDPIEVQSIPYVIARSLFMTTQEGLANIARHSKATQAAVTLRSKPGWLQLDIEDNGRGFDPAKLRRRVGHGLSNMRARAAALQGTVKITSAPGAGTKIAVELPRQSM